MLLMGIQAIHGTASGKVILLLTNGRNKASTNPSFFLLDVDMILKDTATLQQTKEAPYHHILSTLVISSTVIFRDITFS